MPTGRIAPVCRSVCGPVSLAVSALDPAQPRSLPCRFNRRDIAVCEVSVFLAAFDSESGEKVLV